MTLRIQASVAARGFDVGLELPAGQRLAVLGPNGAGKSTLLGLLAGTLRPDTGRAELDDRVLFDLGPAAGPRRWTPPYARGVALLAQDALLFPHLTVLDNVAFGPRSAGRSRRASREVARHWLAEVEATEFATRRPAQLSGGQAQRVAVARALATDPHLLLLDEPMAALDVNAAPLLRRVLRRVLAGRTAVIVSHDLLDAALLADRVLVLDGGAVVETGPTADVLARPRSPFTARLAGLNLVRGGADGTDELAVRRESGELIQGVSGPDRPSPGDAAVAAFGPATVSVFTDPPHGSPRNVIAVTVTEMEPRLELVRVRAADRTGQVLVADVTASAVAELELEPGAAAWFTVKAAAVTIYPA